MKFKCILGIVGISLSISGCVNMYTTQQKHYTYAKPQQRKLNIAKVTSWNIQGAFSVQFAKQSIMASYVWQQSGKKYNLKIAAPLNFATLVIKGQPGKVVMEKGTKNYTAKTPEALMQKQMGWFLPVSNLYYWIRGFPAPGKHKITYDQYGHVRTLQQQGWMVRFENYQTVRGVDLPKIMQLQNAKLKVKLVIKTWRL